MNAITRSLYGATYVPYKPKKVEMRIPFVKVNIMDSLLRGVPKEVTSKILEELEIPDELEGLRRAISDYLENKDYSKFASELGKIDTQSIKTFTAKFMDTVENKLNQTLDTLERTKVEIEKGLNKEKSEDIRDEISNIHKEITSLKSLILARGFIEGGKEKGTSEISKRTETVERKLKSKASPQFIALNKIIKENRYEGKLLRAFIPPIRFERLSKTDPTPLIKASFNYKKKAMEKAIEQLEEGIYVGVLFLERMDFTPVSLVKGELVYTLPITPGEKITVSHKEWAKTVEEFEKELTTITEEEMEKATTERTELAESTTKDEKTEHKFDTGLKVKGGWGAWSIEFSAGYNYDNLKTKHSEFSSKRNREITHKAASRSKEEHKFTFKISREVAREDEQVRVIENKSDEVVRWDFYRLIRKWRIDLYRIGERLTFDIVIPEPGFYLLRKYIELMEIQEQIDRGFVFDLTLEDITEDNYYVNANKYKVSLPQPPEKELFETFTDVLEDPYPPEDEVQKSGIRTIEIKFPQGYKIRDIEIVSPVNGVYFNKHADIKRECLNKYEETPESIDEVRRCIGTDAGAMKEMLYYRSLSDKEKIIKAETNEAKWVWEYFIGSKVHYTEYGERVPHFIINVTAERKEELLTRWKTECFEKIKEAARQQWLQELEGLKNKRDRLLAELTGKDALKLRQIEKEEIMKVVLRWLLGPDFEFFPEELIETTGLEDLPYYEGETTEEEKIITFWFGPIKYTFTLPPEKLMQMNEEIREKMLRYLNTVRFIQQAIEWENVNWILYPYFWTVPERWNFKQSLEHPDFYHEAFLRAGCARVVLTVRPGFEEAFVRFMETGEVDGEIEEDHPYLSLAKEIEASAKTVYKYTPNPNRGEYVFCWDDIPGADERRLKEHIEDIKEVFLKDLPKEEADIWNINWAGVLKNAEIKKEEKNKENEGNEEVIESKIIVNMKSSNKVLVLIFDLDPQNKTIRLIRQTGTLEGNDLTLSEEKILPVRYYISLEKEEKVTKRYVFFVPGEHIDTWYEYTPTGALHVEMGEKPSMW